MLTTPDLRPSSADDSGWDGEIDSFGGRHPVTKAVKLKESAKAVPPDTTVAFDDTFRELPEMRRHRLKEADGWKFTRGVPTDDTSSTTNYSPDLIKIIDGEHKSLLSLGRINEAMEEDDHRGHIMRHRLQLADPHLSETARAALMEHIADHSKKFRKRLRAVDAARKGGRPDIHRTKGYMHGVGELSKALPATTYDVIPQDTHVDTERKRTAGNMAMEAKMQKFDDAVSRAYGGRRTRRGL